MNSVEADAKMLPFRDKAFQYVLSYGAFPEISQPAKVAWEMARVLKERGKILVTAYARGIPSL